MLLNEDKIESTILNQIQHQKIKKYFDFQQYKVLEI